MTQSMLFVTAVGTQSPAPVDLTPYVIFCLGVVTGSVGYCIAQFLLQPILRYIRIRSDISVCLTVFDDALNTKGMNERMKKKQDERRLENRRLSAELHTSYHDLPRLYRLWLKHIRKVKPLSAVRHLRILSTMTDDERAYDYSQAVKTDLALPPWEQTPE